MEQKPLVIAIAGLPTTGKSTLGRALAERTGFHFIDIDVGPASCAYPQEADFYRSPEARARKEAIMRVSYQVLYAAIEVNLKEGFSIIAAATFSRHTSQDALLEAADRGRGTLKVVWCQYDDTREEVERRVTDRVTSGAVGGCRSVSHYLDDKARYSGIKLPHLLVKMEGEEVGIAKVVQQVLQYIVE